MLKVACQVKKEEEEEEEACQGRICIYLKFLVKEKFAFKLLSDA
jgi:hypothetical protein